MSDMDAKFYYEPLTEGLDCIRLLTLYSKQDGGGIACKLEQRTFASKPAYEALSYSWDEEERGRREIRVNGHPFSVRENLYHALDNIRASNDSRVLWVDAICTNQADIPEKNYQVSLTYMIYSRAQRVLVWLGLPQHPIVKNGDAGSFRLRGENDTSSLEMADSPYWTRAWAVQEVGLARDFNVYFGSYCFTSLEFSDQVMRSTPEMAERCLPIMGAKIRELTFPFRAGEVARIQKPLEILLEEFQNMKCGEKRDKIFAFLGLAPDWCDDVVKIDYGMSFYELYARTIEFQQTRNPLVGWSYETKVESLDRHLRLVKFSQFIQRSLGGIVKEEVQTKILSQERMKFYIARGALAGKITFLGPTYKQSISSSRANITWKRDLEAHYRNNGTELLEARELDSKYYHIFEGWDQDQIQRISSIDTKRSYGFQELADDELLSMDGSLAETNDVNGPRRFLGTRGILGFVPPEARLGDTVYMFWECDVAVVLRKIGNDRWMIVGRADMAPRADMASVAKLRYEPDTIWHVALMLDVEKQGRGYRVGVGEIFPYMMNFKLDLLTLQKLTC